ncbi:tautomerase family protein [Xanthobacter sp. KR7-225]|uniref:tautomerase family protein n=1 Tax=Xanthobacter sp. KR7-225 TaxID=3156613 RepID=UPI0032B3CAA0
MPYVEILSSADAAAAAKQALVRAMTDAITGAFNVPPTAVTVFFLPVAPENYGYRGALGEAGDGPRVFIKIHAYQRPAGPRRAVALPISQAASTCFGTPLKHVSIYFLERAFDEVVHDGHLVCDGPAPVL